MYSHAVTYRVCYADTDQMGYVYYGNYARLFEIARVETLRSLGVSYKDLEDQQIGLPVYENYSKFLAPAYYYELLTIECTLISLPQVRIQFSYRILNSKQELIHEGKTTLVFMDMVRQKMVKAPDYLLDVLKPYF